MEIRTERLLLREFASEDWPAVLAYQRDPRYLRFYPDTGRTEADARDFVGRFIDQQREAPRTRFQLAVTLAGSGELIGNVGVRRTAPEARVADLGFEFSPGHWGRGYATEAARAMLAFAFTGLALHRVEAHCVAENAASARVLEKVGMRPEGRLRDSQWFRDRWWDVLLFAVLEDEWRSTTPATPRTQEQSAPHG
jgi:[ribosomal protein S5]-alanine N-acetyltransferase